MDIITIVLQVLIFAALIIAYFLMKNLLPSYFSEKGKNLATKEDVAEITEKIKNIEAKIKVKESGEIDYHSLKRNSILQYFATLNNWQKIITDFHANYEEEFEIKNEIKIGKIKDAKLNYNLREGEIEIFISDARFYNLRKDITLKVLQIQHLFEEHCMNLKHIIINTPDLSTRRTSILSEIKNYQDKRINALTELMPERNLLIQYLDNTLRETFN